MPSYRRRRAVKRRDLDCRSGPPARFWERSDGCKQTSFLGRQILYDLL